MKRITLLGALALLALAFAVAAQQPKLGVVLMHGKGGLPDGIILDLALHLEGKGMLVANLEMPWSSRRDYDVGVPSGRSQVEAAIADLRAKGAARVFVAGHSQGGLFALYVAGRIPVDGVVAIAPGGNVAGEIFREKVSESVARAGELVEQGKGGQRERFLDYEGARGVTPVITNAAAYLTWFHPDGAMNQMAAIRKLDAKTPVLFIAPTRDHPALLKAKPAMVGALPKNPLTKVYEPDSNHVRAPTVSREEIARWIAEVAAQ